MRCLTLAEALRGHGASILFICRDHPGNHATTIRERGFTVTVMPVSRAVPDRTGGQLAGYASWIGDDWRNDAESTARAIAEGLGSSDWIVVDHYALGAEWERELRRVSKRIMAIDDLAERQHDCDLLLDQNLVEGFVRRYEGKVPAGVRTLLGPSYAMLQPVYARLHKQAKPRSGKPGKLFVAFGGADSANLTGRIVSAFLGLGNDEATMDVVVDVHNPHTAGIRDRVSGRPNVRLLSGLPTLAPLMKEADAAIGATGATTWERCCLGLPAIVITLADNQRPIARTLDAMGIVRWLGDVEAVDDAGITAALRELLETPLDPRWSARCLELVDGHGADRVRLAMTVPLLEHDGIRLRRAEEPDAERLRAWRNDPATVAASRQSTPVSEADHAKWFSAALRDANRDIYIAQRGEAAVGMVRVDRREEGQELSWAVSPAARGEGVGKTMVALVADVLDGIVYAEVKPGNEASAAIARHAGLTDETNHAGMRRFTRPGGSS